MGFLFSKYGYDPRRDIPDLTGKVALVTGANAGIGFQTAEQLAIHGARVYLACRTESKAKAAISGIENRTPSLKGQDRLIWLPLDLSSLKCAKNAADVFSSKEKRLDILVNNAGRMAEDYVINAEGVELSVAVNHLGHFVLTTALLPLLKETARQRGADVRIVVVSSYVYASPGRTTFLSLEDFNDPQSEPGKENVFGGRFKRYRTTKFLNVLFTNELQRQLDEEGVPITAISLDPGGVATEGAAALNLPWHFWIFLKLFAKTALEGAYTSLFAATSAQVAAERHKYKGKYVVPVGKIEGPSTEAAKDASGARTLWETSEKVVTDILGRSA